MHIAFDARMVHYRRSGGIGQYALSLLRAMQSAPGMTEHDSVAVLQMRADLVPIVRDRRFRRVPMWTPPHNRFEQPALGIELLKIGPQPQLIHSPDFVPPRFRRFPAVVNIQDLAFLKFPETTLLTDESKRYYGQVYKSAREAQALIALSNSARDDIVALLGVPHNKVAVISGAASDAFKPPPDVTEAQRDAAGQFKLPSPEEGGYILFVSTIEPRKNLPMLLEAYRLILDRKRLSPPPVLAVGGREGWLYEQVYARIDELNLREHVRLLGEVATDRLVSLYQGARLYALPSLYEGFGLTALEAMACGVPVLASSSGSLPEVVGDAGLLLDPNDAAAWADSIERLLSDTQEEQRLRAAGPPQAARFSWQTAATETWSLYRRVAN